MVKAIIPIAIGIAIIIMTLFVKDLVTGTPDPAPIDTVIVTKIDTVEIFKKYTGTLKPKIIKDTVTTTDTLWVTTYVAEADTTFEDSTATVSVKFRSPIPLSSLAYFKLKLEVKELTINITEETTITVEKQKGWFEAFIDRFGVGVYAGMGFDASGKLSPQVGVGLMFEF